MKNVCKNLALIGLSISSGIAAATIYKLVDRRVSLEQQRRDDKDEVKKTYARVRLSSDYTKDPLDELDDEHIVSGLNEEQEENIKEEHPDDELSALLNDKKLKKILEQIRPILEDNCTDDDCEEDYTTTNKLCEERNFCLSDSNTEGKNCALKRLIFKLTSSNLDDSTIAEINSFAAQQCKLCKVEDVLYNRIKDK